MWLSVAPPIKDSGLHWYFFFRYAIPYATDGSTAQFGLAPPASSRENWRNQIQPKKFPTFSLTSAEYRGRYQGNVLSSQMS